MTDYYLSEIAAALDKRANIEEAKLDFEREVFNYNKQIEESNKNINLDSTKGDI